MPKKKKKLRILSPMERYSMIVDITIENIEAELIGLRRRKQEIQEEIAINKQIEEPSKNGVS
jgi:hypothetical protein